MRISETHVVQLIESEPPKIVVVDDQSGDELTFTRAQLSDLLPFDPSKPITLEGVDPDHGATTITLADEGESDRFLRALDYFWPHL